MKTHTVKEWREHYGQLLEQIDPRRVEIRINDRDYKPHDQIIINEVILLDPQTLETQPTGSWCRFEITRVWASPHVRAGYVALQLGQLLDFNTKFYDPSGERSPSGKLFDDENAPPKPSTPAHAQ